MGRGWVQGMQAKQGPIMAGVSALKRGEGRLNGEEREGSKGEPGLQARGTLWKRVRREESSGQQKSMGEGRCDNE